jgi:hypothetical protein
VTFTKKHTAITLATAAAIQIAAYGGYQWVKYPADKGGSMTEREEQLARMEQQRAQEKIERWRTHPQEEGNPEWMIAKILRGRAPDDATLTEYESSTIQIWRDLADRERRVASGEVKIWGVDLSAKGLGMPDPQTQASARRWEAAAERASETIEPYKPRPR